MVFPSPIGWGRPLPWLVDSRLFLAHFIIMTEPLSNDTLRSVHELKPMPKPVARELETWLLEAADKPSTPLTKSDFDGIRQRVVARIKASAA